VYYTFLLEKHHPFLAIPCILVKVSKDFNFSNSLAALIRCISCITFFGGKCCILGEYTETKATTSNGILKGLCGTLEIIGCFSFGNSNIHWSYLSVVNFFQKQLGGAFIWAVIKRSLFKLFPIKPIPTMSHISISTPRAING
jgi:hypothetical protein